ncbi:hypothetical protein HMPREF1548_00346 [Clostridium sp. KLE 1755]|nr:hypothetical protein HMPREF1548_00346 [Clostridium sp. KLE 1755]
MPGTDKYRVGSFILLTFLFQGVNVKIFKDMQYFQHIQKD